MLRFLIVFLLVSCLPLVAMAAATSPLPTSPSTPPAKAAPVPAPSVAKPAAQAAPSRMADQAPTNGSGEVSSDDPYTVHGVQVDVSAKNSMEARDKAFTMGQQTAFLALAKSMAGDEAVKVPSETEVAKLVKSFEVETERASGTRYTATLTYHFKPQATAALLGKNGVEVSDDPYNRPKKPDSFQALSATTMPPERVLVLPILRAPDRNILWEEKTPWHRAWSNVLSDRPMPDLILAEGTQEDVGAITSSEALAGLNLPLTRIMRKYQARGILVAVLMANNNMPQSNQNLSVQLARFDDHGKMLGTIILPAPPQPNAKDIEWLQGSVQNSINAWRDNVAKSRQQQPATNYAVVQPGAPMPVAATPQYMRVLLTVPFANMEEWEAKREALQGVPGIAGLEVQRMNRFRAVVQIDYAGPQAQLDQALSNRNMQIMPTNPPDGTYMLSSTGQPQPAPAGAQPVFRTVYPGEQPVQQPMQVQPMQMQPGQIPPAQTQPVGEIEPLPPQQEEPSPHDSRFGD